MDDQWLEAWELPMPSSPLTAAWEEKASVQQVQDQVEDVFSPSNDYQLFEDIDLMASLDSACESQPIDLTEIIGNLLGEQEDVVLSVDDIVKAVCIGEDYSSCYPVQAEATVVEDRQITVWFDNGDDAGAVPMTVNMSDLLPTNVLLASVEEEETISEDWKDETYVGENVADETASTTVADEIIVPFDRRKKGARKRRGEAFDADWTVTDDDDDLSTSGRGVGVEKRSKVAATACGAPLDKGSAEYRRKHQEVEDSLNRSAVENRELRSRVETLTREVDILRGLFTSIGAEIPKDVVARINIATQPLPLRRN